VIERGRRKTFCPTKRLRGVAGSDDEKRRVAELREARDGTWAKCPAVAACDRSLGQVTPLHVLNLLCKYRDSRTGDCFPSVKQLACDLGVKHRRSIQRHIDKLVELGYVIVVARRTEDGRSQTSNAYIVLYPMLSEAKNSAQEGKDAEEGGPPAGPDTNSSSGLAMARKPAEAPCVTGHSESIGNRNAPSIVAEQVKPLGVDRGDDGSST
jgi:hypothetical protein